MSELLKNIRVASPCSVDWNTMTGDDRTRYCSQCNLNVYNLSAMSEREVHKLVSDQTGRMCVRFYRRKDGTVLTQNCPVGLKIVMQRVSRVAGIALSALMSAVPMAAQAPSRNYVEDTQNKRSSDLVIDAAQQPPEQGAIADVSVVLIPPVDSPSPDTLDFVPVPSIEPVKTLKPGFFHRLFNKLTGHSE